MGRPQRLLLISSSFCFSNLHEIPVVRRRRSSMEHAHPGTTFAAVGRAPLRPRSVSGHRARRSFVRCSSTCDVTGSWARVLRGIAGPALGVLERGQHWANPAVAAGRRAVVPTCSSPCARLRSGITSGRPGGSCWPSVRDWRLGGARGAARRKPSVARLEVVINKALQANPPRLLVTHTARREQETVNTRGSILGCESPSGAAELLRWHRKSPRALPISLLHLRAGQSTPESPACGESGEFRLPPASSAPHGPVSLSASGPTQASVASASFGYLASVRGADTAWSKCWTSLFFPL